MSRSILSPLLALSSVLILSASARAEDVPVPPVTPVAGAPVASETTPTALTPGGLAGVDVMTATVFQQGQSSFSGLGLRFRINDSRLLENIEVLPTVEYWRNNTSLAIGSFGRVHAIRRDATIGSDVRWMFKGETFRGYAGAGIGVHFLSNEVEIGGTRVSDSLTKGGLTLLAGVSFASQSRFGNFLELKGHFVGGYRQIKLNMGLSWNR